MPEAVAHTVGRRREERDIRRGSCSLSLFIVRARVLICCGLGQFKSESTCLQDLHYMIFDN